MPLLFAELPFPGWDPVALQLGPLAIRWYGLGYLAGFLICGLVLDRLSKAGFIQLSKDAVSDLIGWLVLGVLVGGRLGYALFYERQMLLAPLELIKVWKGGLSFHGGVVGVILGTGWFARRRGISWRRLTDGLVLCAPFGIALVRCANFINAELYGRVAPIGLPWGVRFPTDPVARLASPELAQAGGLRWHEAYEGLVASGRWAGIAAGIPLRHPSQLYEALLEGVLLAMVLWSVYRWRRAALRPGGYAALFLGGYALARFGVEFTRQPDPQLGFVLGPLSMGQVLSLAMAVGALVFALWPAAGSNSRSGPAAL